MRVRRDFGRSRATGASAAGSLGSLPLASLVLLRLPWRVLGRLAQEVALAPMMPTTTHPV